VRSPFIELTVVADPGSISAGVWTALVRRDQITAVEDLSARNLAGNPKCRVTLAGPIELVDDDGTATRPIRDQRELAVKEDFAAIKAFLESDSDGCGCCY
jgi:hypothetical protein